jgi:large subunit ribosomal protein L24
MNMKIKLKKGDTVKVISGEARGQQGKIIHIDRDKYRAVVEGVNMITKNEKPSARNTKGGMVKKEGSIHISNLMFVEGGKPTRLARRVNEKSGKSERISAKTKEALK